MPEPIKYATTANLGGVPFVRRADGTGTVSEKATPTILGAKAGTLTGRTDANTGVITLQGGHGLTSGVGDVFWGVGSRRGMTWTISTNALTVDGGSGDDLPVTGTPVTVMKPVTVAFDVTGNNVTGLGVKCPVAGYVAPFDNADPPVEITAFEVGKDLDYIWKPGLGEDNPLEDKVTTAVKITHAATTPQVVTVVAVTGNGS